MRPMEKAGSGHERLAIILAGRDLIYPDPFDDQLRSKTLPRSPTDATCNLTLLSSCPGSGTGPLETSSPAPRGAVNAASKTPAQAMPASTQKASAYPCVRA
jgi:hypothetical protein